MRLTSMTRVLVPPALCAAIVLTAVGPAAALTTVPEPAPLAASAGSSVPGASELSRRVELLRHTPGVPAAVTELLDDALEADGERMSLATAIRHKVKVEIALAQMRATGADRAVRADALSDTLTALQTALDDLLSAATTGLTDLVGSVVSLVTGLLDTVVGTLAGVVSGIGLPALPADATTLPTDATTLPADTSALPVDTSALLADATTPVDTSALIADPMTPFDTSALIADAMTLPDIPALPAFAALR